MIDIGRVLNDGAYDVKVVRARMIGDVLPEANATGALSCVRFTDYVVPAVGDEWESASTKSFRAVQVSQHLEQAGDDDGDSHWAVNCPPLPITVGASDAHIVVGEVLNQAEEVVAWFELVCDVVGNHTRALRLPPVEPTGALHDQTLRATHGNVDVEIATQGPTPPKARAGRSRKAAGQSATPAVADGTANIEESLSGDATGSEIVPSAANTSRRGRTQSGSHKNTPAQKTTTPSTTTTAKVQEATEDEEVLVAAEAAAPHRHAGGARRRRSGFRPQLIARVNNLRNDALNLTTRKYFRRWAQISATHRDRNPADGEPHDNLMEFELQYDEKHDEDADDGHHGKGPDDVQAKYMEMMMAQRDAEKSAKQLAEAKMEEAKRREAEEKEKADLEAKYFEMLMAQQEAERQTKLRVALSKLRDEESQERNDITNSMQQEYRRLAAAEISGRMQALQKREALGRQEIDDVYMKLLAKLGQQEEQGRRAAMEAERIRKTFVPPEDGAVVIGFDSIVGIPLNVRWTRLRVFIADETDASGHVISPPLASVELFATVDSIFVQDVHSKCSEPTFTSSRSEIQPHAGPSTRIVVLIDCALKDEFSGGWFTLAHCVFPIHDVLVPSSGHFTAKLRLGDPSSTLHVNAEESARLRQNLPYDPMDTDIVPGAYMCWRKNRLAAAVTGEVVELEDPTIVSDFELEAREARRTSDLSYEICSNHLPAFTDVKELEEAIFSPSLNRVAPTDETLTYLSPYVGPSAIFVNVECLLGAPIVPKGVHKVAVEVVTAPPPEAEWGEDQAIRSGFTDQHDFDSPIYYPQYLRNPIVFGAFHMDRRAFLLFRIFSISTLKHHEVQEIGWSVTRLYLRDKFLRQGRFMCPVFGGTPPPALLQGLRSSKGLENVLHSSLLSGKVRLADPKMLLRFSQGYLERSEPILDRKGPFSSVSPLYIRPLAPENLAKLEEPPPGGGAVTKPLRAMFGSSVEKALQAQESTNARLKVHITENVPRVIVQRRASVAPGRGSVDESSAPRENRLISFFSFQPDPNHRDSLTEDQSGRSPAAVDSSAIKIQRWARALTARQQRRQREAAVQAYLDDCQRREQDMFGPLPPEVDEESDRRQTNQEEPLLEEGEESKQPADVIPPCMFETEECANTAPASAAAEGLEVPAEEYVSNKRTTPQPLDDKQFQGADGANGEGRGTPQSVATEPANVGAASPPSSLTKRLTYSETKEPPGLERCDTMNGTAGGGGASELATVTSYNETDGYFIRVESLRGVEPNAHYRIVVEPPAPSIPYMLDAPDASSDSGAPEFRDIPVVHKGCPPNDLAVALFHILAFDPDQQEVRQVGWTIARVFSDGGLGRKGRFQAPVFAGVPPPALLEHAAREPLRVVIKAWLAPDKRRSSLNASKLSPNVAGDETSVVDYLSPRCVLTFSQGAANDMQELCFTPNPPPPSVVLIVPKRQKEFPLGAEDGVCGFTVGGVAEASGVSPDSCSGLFEAFLHDKWLKDYVL